VAAGNGEADRLALSIDAGKLRCSSIEDEGTKGGRGHRRSIQGRSIQQGRWNTGAAVSFTRRLGFRLLLIKIHCRTGTIYRVFCTES
jgi:hypothetical protein